MRRPGSATLRRHDDGTVSVVDAADVIAVSSELVAEALACGAMVDDVLTLDTAGEYRYRVDGRCPSPSGGRDDFTFVRIREAP